MASEEEIKVTFNKVELTGEVASLVSFHHNRIIEYGDKIAHEIYMSALAIDRERGKLFENRITDLILKSVINIIFELYKKENVLDSPGHLHVLFMGFICTLLKFISSCSTFKPREKKFLETFTKIITDNLDEIYKKIEEEFTVEDLK